MPIRLLTLLLFGVSPILAGIGRVESNVSYLKPEDLASADSYRAERAKLDLYLPAQTHAAPVIIWFHGGGLNQGEKWIPDELRAIGCIVAAPGYRLTPKARAVDCLLDASAAVAWVFKNIGEKGGDTRSVFLTGHSAGGYLSIMLALDRKWLRAHGVEADHIAGVIPFSTQTITHAAFRQEKDIPPTQPIVDEFSPLFHVRPEAPPILLITGDREQELWGRYEENAYFARMLKIAGHKSISLVEIPGADHGGMVKPAFPLLVAEVRRILASRMGSHPLR